jgi:serine/threonine protein phosphatase PrpC
LGRDGKAIPLSKDHKPQDEEEKKRIEAAGHEVFKESALFKGTQQ